ncbi:MAG: excinuclease ABC subunit UvrC [Candidatus Tectomicrobia bacterium]|uniref:UvrABC system protein C n=1 Tax=Tectimicrobiota bacterium TaxID=2528274 RepID=A0A932M2N4_UNCTE|nr:excinuclease ABC subunit UvrC [Candidatus Tectomicrobia bacterium]
MYWSPRGTPLLTWNPRGDGQVKTETLLEQVERFPRSPGVYLMKNRSGKVVYVGKAKNLRARVRSYFRAAGDGRLQIRFLLPVVTDIDFVATDTEKEALLLENNLIKEHRPKYNINFRDDKDYVSIKLNVKARYPRLTIVRRPQKDENVYFGPYSSAYSARETLRFIQRHFPLRSCTDNIFRNRTRPCLYYEIKECVGPCVAGLTTDEEYQELVKQVTLFLQGRKEELVRELKDKMHAASEKLAFEDAARYHRKIQAIEQTVEPQKVISYQFRDQDVFGYYRKDGEVVMERLLVRRGKLTEAKSFLYKDQVLPDPEILASCLEQYYLGESFIPREILLPFSIEGTTALAEILNERRSGPVGILVPRRGQRRNLIQMATKNAELALQQAHNREEKRLGALAQIQAKLHLRALPRRIECFDISNIMGKEAVGSLVSFLEGEPDKTRYRHFRIRTLSTPNDYAMMREILERRYRKAIEEMDLPNLILIDGGKGQLGIAEEILRELGIGEPDLAGIAKSRLQEAPERKGKAWSEERFYLPGRKNPVFLPPSSEALFLLQRVRDEAHRFAITYHKKLWGRETLRSPLEEIPGIGSRRKRDLLSRFGSLKGLQEATPEEIAGVPGIGIMLAREIHARLHAAGPGESEEAPVRESAAGAGLSSNGDR